MFTIYRKKQKNLIDKQNINKNKNKMAVTPLENYIGASWPIDLENQDKRNANGFLFPDWFISDLRESAKYKLTPTKVEGVFLIGPANGRKEGSWTFLLFPASYGWAVIGKKVHGFEISILEQVFTLENGRWKYSAELSMPTWMINRKTKREYIRNEKGGWHQVS